MLFSLRHNPSDNASPFDLSDELQENITVPVVMKRNLIEINGQREILRTPVEMGDIIQLRC